MLGKPGSRSYIVQHLQKIHRQCEARSRRDSGDGKCALPSGFLEGLVTKEVGVLDPSLDPHVEIAPCPGAVAG